MTNRDELNRIPGFPAVEMPGEIVAMETVNERLYVTLIDGRRIDMTDWFKEHDRRPN